MYQYLFHTKLPDKTETICLTTEDCIRYLCDITKYLM